MNRIFHLHPDDNVAVAIADLPPGEPLPGNTTTVTGAIPRGRGSVFGSKPLPSIKIATNTPMFRHMEEDMDINAGTIADGEETHAQVADRIYQEILRVAGGGQSKSEALGFGDSEFVPWNISAQM